MVEFEDFSTCWAEDELKAKGFAAEVRRVVNVKDSFTRMNHFSPHLVRLFGRANASGIFISNSPFTEADLKEGVTALNQWTIFLCSLEEIVMLLQRETDLVSRLRKKSHAAVVDKQPFLKVL